MFYFFRLALAMPSPSYADCDLGLGNGTRPLGTIVYNTNYEVLQVCRSDGLWHAMGPFPSGDTTPDAFSFADQTGVAVSTPILSNTETITGIDKPAAVSITGDGTPEFRIAGGSWVTTGTITNGQTLQLRLTSNASGGTMNSATVTVGTASDQWDVTTAGGGPTGCPTIGDVCSDGSIFAGDTNMYVTDVNQSTGIQWSTETVDTGADSMTDGAANQAWIVANETLSQYPAFQLCENLTRHGHTDWYLPARNELNVLRTNRNAIGGFTASQYWSSTESSNIGYAWYQTIGTGYQGNGQKIGGFFDVRCVRRD